MSTRRPQVWPEFETMRRSKRFVGPRPRAVNEDARKVEAAAGCNVLSRMLGLGRARSVRIVAAVDA